MRKLLLMVGLPRSGKSTIARRLARKFGCPLVSRDAVRLALHGKRFLPWAEETVAAQTAVTVRALFISGADTVILDECNVTEAQRKAWRSPHWLVEHIVVGTQPAVCIQRARADDDPEIIAVIERMAAQWEDPRPEETASRSLPLPFPACGGPEGWTQ